MGCNLYYFNLYLLYLFRFMSHVAVPNPARNDTRGLVDPEPARETGWDVSIFRATRFDLPLELFESETQLLRVDSVVPQGHGGRPRFGLVRSGTYLGCPLVTARCTETWMNSSNNDGFL